MEEDATRRPGRPCKYSSEEERIAGIKQKKHEYYLRTREMRGIDPERDRGRPRKYHTEEEEREAKKKYQALYRLRRGEKKREEKNS